MSTFLIRFHSLCIASLCVLLLDSCNAKNIPEEILDKAYLEVREEKSIAQVQKNFDVNSLIMDEKTYPIIVLGSGPGGLTAAIYAATANINCLVIQGDIPGGALTQSDLVRNWPGQIDIVGAQLMDKIFDQAKYHGVKTVEEKVVSVDFSVWPRVIQTESIFDSEVKNTYKALSVIIATGSVANKLNIPGERKYWGRGVSNCAICDGSLYADKDVIVVGGDDDAAMIETAYLSGIARSVTVLMQNERLHVRDSRRDYVMSQSNIEILLNTTIEKILGDQDGVTGVQLREGTTKTTFVRSVDGVFLAIGSKPNTQIFDRYLLLDQNGYIKVNDLQETTISGVFATGDVADPLFKQAVTASADGCKATHKAVDFLQEAGYNPTTKQKISSVFSTQKELPSDAAQEPVVQMNNARVQTLSIKTEDQFEEYVLSNQIPVVVDFYATWCGPCNSMMPIIKDLAQEYGDTVQFIKINGDQANQLIRKFNIRGYPTFIFYKKGKQVLRFSGATSKANFKNNIEKKLL